MDSSFKKNCLIETIIGTTKEINCTFALDYRGVAQLVARYVRDVEAGSSSLLTPTNCHGDVL